MFILKACSESCDRRRANSHSHVMYIDELTYRKGTWTHFILIFHRMTILNFP